MKKHNLRSESVLGVVAIVVGVVLLSVCTVPAGAAPPKPGASQLTRGPASGAPVQVSPQCGAVLHDPHRVITFVWNPAPPSNGYQVEVDCFDCVQVGHWDSEVGPPKFVSTSGATTATFTFSGDNKGRWRVRGTQTASAPGMSAIQAGPWSPWCKFRFETGTIGTPPGGPGQPCGINLASLSKSSGHPGETFEMNGTWGSPQGTKVPCINKGAENHLQVLTWTPTKLTVKIPLTLEPGVYKVGVYCEDPQHGAATYSSGWKDFEVLAFTPSPTHP